MNLLSLMRNKYTFSAGELNKKYLLMMYSHKPPDNDGYSEIQKLELETLRDNAKKLYEACNNALPEDEQI